MKQTKSSKGRNGRKEQVLQVSVFSLALILTLILLLNVGITNADPAGASITSNITSTAPSYSPGNRSDNGGTINTLTFNVVQQDANWKAYVGNISGTLTLDDSNGKSIYQWAMTNADITGEIYATKIDNPDWSIINCSNQTTTDAEDTALGFSNTSVDSINRTFNETTHQSIFVAGRTIAANTCKATSTYVNNTAQNQSSADFQQILFSSGTDVVYVSPINQGKTSYDGNSTVDFQMLIADDITAAITPYYFFVEIG